MADSPILAFDLVDDDVRAPGFRVTALGDGFSGVTDIWLMRADADAFVDALDSLDSSLKGEACLRAGWVEQGEPPTDAKADLLLSIFPCGQAGQLEVHVTLRASASQGGKNSATISFVLPEPGALTRFRRAFHRLVDGKVGPPAVLTAAITHVDL